MANNLAFDVPELPKQNLAFDVPDIQSGKPSEFWGAVNTAIGKVPTITSTTGGKHNVGSLHYQQRAFDVRTRDLTDEQVSMVMDIARQHGLKVRDERTRPNGQKEWNGAHLHFETPEGYTRQDFVGGAGLKQKAAPPQPGLIEQMENIAYDPASALMRAGVAAGGGTVDFLLGAGKLMAPRAPQMLINGKSLPPVMGAFQDDIKGLQDKFKTGTDATIQELGGPDIASKAGEFASWFAPIMGMEKGISRIPQLTTAVTDALLPRILKSAARGAITGDVLTSMKTGDPVEGLKAVPWWAGAEAALPIAGALLKTPANFAEWRAQRQFRGAEPGLPEYATNLYEFPKPERTPVNTATTTGFSAEDVFARENAARLVAEQDIKANRLKDVETQRTKNANAIARMESKNKLRDEPAIAAMKEQQATLKTESKRLRYEIRKNIAAKIQDPDFQALTAQEFKSPEITGESSFYFNGPENLPEPLYKMNLFDERGGIAPEKYQNAAEYHATKIDDGIAKMEQMAERKNQSIAYSNAFFDQGWDVGKKMVNNEVVPISKAAVKNARIFTRGIVNVLSPRTGVKSNILDILGVKRGTQDFEVYQVAQQMNKAQRLFEKMPQEEQIAFFDRIKTGKIQPEPWMQGLADSMRELDNQLYGELSFYKAETPYKENHMRVVWKVIPGKEPIEATPRQMGFGRRPPEGSKGWSYRATLPDMSTGLARGGVPITYNPVEMFVHTYQDAMKFITTNRMVDSLVDSGAAEWKPKGEAGSAGFVEFKPALVQRGGKQGALWMDADAARLIENYISSDSLRTNVAGNNIGAAKALAGNSLLAIKNTTTAIELSLSPFHFMFEAGEAISSSMGIAARRLYNLGDFKGAGKELLRSPLAPKDIYQIGKRTIKMIGDKDFFNTPEGKAYAKQFPEAEQHIKDLFNGGLKLEMAPEYRLNQVKAMRSAWANEKYLEGLGRAPLAGIEEMMYPLFNTYIPRLKVGVAMKEYGLALLENKGKLAKGVVTREELARKIVDFVEDRFGEMNFDNLYWDRTFKTAMQITFRSVTWKLGNLRAMGGAPIEQGAEIYNALVKPTGQRIARLAGREGAVSPYYKPLLTPKGAWLLGMSTFTIVMNSAIQKAYTGLWPQEIKDVFFPRFDRNDDTKRFNTFTYWKDIFHIKKNPLGYAASSMSGMVGRLIDIWKNKDFYGEIIADPSDSEMVQMKDRLAHMFILPFSVSSYRKLSEQGERPAVKAGTFFGLTKASAEVSQTPAEQKMWELARGDQMQKPRTHAEALRLRTIKDLRNRRLAGQDIKADMDSAWYEGIIGQKDKQEIVGPKKDMWASGLQRRTAWETIDVYDLASPGEKKKIAPILLKKIRNYYQGNAKLTEKEELLAKYKQIQKDMKR